MINEPVLLKHGQIEARLLFCNRAYRDARHELGNLLSINDIEDGVRHVNFMVSYLYNSYLSCCKKENKPVLIDFMTFDESITFVEVPKTDSNLAEVFDKAGETIKVYLSFELENVKKKIEEMKEIQATTN